MTVDFFLSNTYSVNYLTAPLRRISDSSPDVYVAIPAQVYRVITLLSRCSSTADLQLKLGGRHLVPRPQRHRSQTRISQNLALLTTSAITFIPKVLILRMYRALRLHLAYRSCYFHQSCHSTRTSISKSSRLPNYSAHYFLPSVPMARH